MSMREQRNICTSLLRQNLRALAAPRPRSFALYALSSIMAAGRCREVPGFACRGGYSPFLPPPSLSFSLQHNHPLPRSLATRTEGRFECGHVPSGLLLRLISSRSFFEALMRTTEVEWLVYLARVLCCGAGGRRVLFLQRQHLKYRDLLCRPPGVIVFLIISPRAEMNKRGGHVYFSKRIVPGGHFPWGKRNTARPTRSCATRLHSSSINKHV